ncbi:hypothetical protein AB205_0156540 [Aquarana catesbeiana]|nr:hypothetical protein AB205_0156540 [Aquarana catesbeiana]
MFSALNSAKTDNCTTLPSNVSYSYFLYLCAKYTFIFIHIGEKRLGTSEETRDPPPLEEGEIPPTQPEEEGDVFEIGEIVTTTSDVAVVEEECHVK